MDRSQSGFMLYNFALKTCSDRSVVVDRKKNVLDEEKIVILFKVLSRMIKTMRIRDEVAKRFKLKQGKMTLLPTSIFRV